MTNSQNKLATLQQQLVLLKLEELRRANGGVIPYPIWAEIVWRARDQVLNLKTHPWILPIMQDRSNFIVAKKAAQMGYTEWALSESVYLPDQYKANSLYFMPTGSGLSDLVQARLDPSIASSPYLAPRVGKQSSHKYTEKVGLKRLYNGYWYGRGAQTKKQVKTVDADGVWVDERDELDDEIVPYIPKRLQHSSFKWQRWFGTPTVAGWGIDLMYLEGKQFVWNITCPHCQTEQALNYQDNVDAEAKKLVCHKCKEQIVPIECDGRYIAENPSAGYSSYYCSGLVSPFLDLEKLIADLQSGDENRIAQAYNQALGLSYEPKGATITVEDLYACKGQHSAPFKAEEGIYLGVDVGRVLHFWGMTKDKRVVLISTGSWDDLRRILREWKVKVCVIDALPELEAVSQIVSEFRGKVFACYYNSTKMEAGKYHKFGIGKVEVNRTASLDASTALIMNQDIVLPSNLDSISDVITHFKNIKRVVIEKKDNTGDKEIKWIRIADDHYTQAFNYSNIALQRLSTINIY
jgi:hypothetical protein